MNFYGASFADLLNQDCSVGSKDRMVTNWNGFQRAVFEQK